MKRRSGFTLIELLFVISVGAVLLGISAAWIHQALHYGSTLRERERQHRTLILFARQFRSDVHRSTAMEFVDGDTLILREGTGRTVKYVIGESAIIATRESDGEIQNERYHLADTCIAKWQSSSLPDQLEPGQVGLIVFRPLRVRQAETRDGSAVSEARGEVVCHLHAQSHSFETSSNAEGFSQ